LYFGHPINVYGTPLQEDLLAAIAEAFPDWEIVNPGEPEHEAAYQRYVAEGKRGMQYFFEEVLPSCDGGVFLPFADGAWGKGVFGEAEVIARQGGPLWKIFPDGRVEPASIGGFGRVLSVEETRERIRLPSGERRPYGG
jgi:hypothetical protein